MRKGGVRDEQLASLIGEELEFVLATASDRRLSELTVTNVEPEPGGARFIVFVAPVEGSDVFGSVDEMRELLKRAIGFLRSELATTLNLKKAPQLTILPDPFVSFGLK